MWQVIGFLFAGVIAILALIVIFGILLIAWLSEGIEEEE